MPHELGLKIALEHTRTTKLSWRFLLLFYNVVVVFKNNICQSSKICYQEQRVIRFTQSEMYPFKFLLEHYLHPVFVLFLFFQYSFILECLFMDAVFCCYAPESNTDTAL